MAPSPHDDSDGQIFDLSLDEVAIGDAADPNAETKADLNTDLNADLNSGDSNAGADIYEIAPGDEIELGPTIEYVPPPELHNNTGTPPAKSKPRPKPKYAPERRESGGGEKGSGGSSGGGRSYERDGKRSKKMRGQGAKFDSSIVAENQTARVWKIIIIGAIASVAALLVSGAVYLAPSVRRMNATDYKPMDGILTGMQGKALLAALDDQGKLVFRTIKNYDAKSDGGELLVKYDTAENVPFNDAVPYFVKSIPQLEYQFMNRPLTPPTAEELKRMKILKLLREAVAEWKIAQPANDAPAGNQDTKPADTKPANMKPADTKPKETEPKKTGMTLHPAPIILAINGRDFMRAV